VKTRSFFEFPFFFIIDDMQQKAAAAALRVAVHPMAAAQQQPESPLRFVDAPYDEALTDELVQHFRDEGWCVLPDVYVRASVAPFRAQLAAKLTPSPGERQAFALEAGAVEQWEPSMAPRIQSFLPQLLTPAHGRAGHSAVQLFEASLHRNIPDAGEGTLPPQGWHRDRGGAAGAGEEHYRLPEAAHCATYFRDMVPGSGATELIARSHVDLALTADNAPPELFVAFNLRAQDVAVYDQRCLHRRGPFTPDPERDEAVDAPDGIRLFCNMAFVQQQLWREDGVGPMPSGLAEKWIKASAAGEHGVAQMLGGRWSPASVWAAVERLRRADSRVAALLEEHGSKL
jgi:hypothetical protein